MVASQVEDEVMEYTRKIVRNPQFIKDLQEKVMTAVDMTEVENDITAYKTSYPLYSAAATAWSGILTALLRMTSMQSAAAQT